jgi:hypothetical protein
MKKRSQTLHTIQIGNKKFSSEDPTCFGVKRRDVEKIAITNLPLNITLEFTSRALRAKIGIMNIGSNLIRVSFHQILSVTEWLSQISMEIFYNIKRELILSNKNLNPQIDVYDRDLLYTIFGYSINISGSTVGEVIKITLKINKEIDAKIDRAVKMGIRYINIVAQRGFQIDVSKFFSGNNKKSKV